MPGPVIGARIQCYQAGRSIPPRGTHIESQASLHSWSPSHQLLILFLPWSHVVFMIVIQMIVGSSSFKSSSLIYNINMKRKNQRYLSFSFSICKDQNKDQMKWFMWKNIFCQFWGFPNVKYLYCGIRFYFNRNYPSFSGHDCFIVGFSRSVKDALIVFVWRVALEYHCIFSRCLQECCTR